MSQRIIHLAERSIAAMDVGDDLSRQMPRRCRGESFDAIADDHHDIALQSIEGRCQKRNRAAGALRSFKRRAAAEDRTLAFVGLPARLEALARLYEVEEILTA